MNDTRASPESHKISVVIPYYQEEPGILRGAVMSAIAQEGVSDLEIIVVDDGSPAPACDDLKDLDLPAHVTLKLLEQSNRGPGAARNRALDAVAEDTAYVAFLDSDDRWQSTHLSNAIDVLTDSADFYFADAWSSDSEYDFFSEREFDVGAHVGIDGKRHAYLLALDVQSRLLSGRSFIHTSTVVYRYRRFADVRFAERYWLGEDISFWMDLAARTERFAVSSALDCKSGRGFHIYNSCGWGTSKAIWGLCENMKWRRDLKRTLIHHPTKSKANLLRIREIRAAFVAAVLHNLRTGRGLTEDMFRFIKADPISVIYFLPVAAKLILSKLRSDF